MWPAYRAELTVPKAGTNQHHVTKRCGLGHLQYDPRQRYLFPEYELVCILAKDPMRHRAFTTEFVGAEHAQRSRPFYRFPSSWMPIKPRLKRLLLHTSSRTTNRLRHLLLPDPFRHYDPQQYGAKLLVVYQESYEPVHDSRLYAGRYQ